MNTQTPINALVLPLLESAIIMLHSRSLSFKLYNQFERSSLEQNMFHTFSVMSVVDEIRGTK
jgi:hypothetical protein